MVLCGLAGLLVSPAPAQKKPDRFDRPDKAELREIKELDAIMASGGKRDKDAGAKSKPRAEDPAARGLAKMRELLEVTDDAEWEIISARITEVVTMRASFGKLGASGKGGPSGGDKGKANARPGASAHPEHDALRYAIRDKLPDAEVKARLARVHEVYEQTEARLAKAQADLRAVLTVRQEAVAVLSGLLPP